MSSTRVLLVGTVHLANPGLDRFNVRVDDVFAPARQAEIIDVVQRLAEFRPTHVAVEALPTSDVLERYAAFGDGRHELTRNEVEQIGFRVAQAAQAEIVPADVAARFYEPGIEQLILEGPHRERWAAFERSGQQTVDRIGSWFASHPIGEILYRLNAPDELRGTSAPYADLLRIASPESDAGPRMVANWYVRNVLIVGNILRSAPAGARSLVLFGQGHIPVLKQLFEAIPDVEVDDPLTYLPRSIEGIAQEIIAMAKVDQEMRHAAASGRSRWDPTVDAKNTARLRSIIAQVGWPTRSRVGDHAEHQAWLLVQHADADPDFQRECFELMRREPPSEVCAKHLAYLEDRIRTGEGRPQLYGTQLHQQPDGTLAPAALEDAEHVDERRAAVGLEPLADYLARARPARIP